jgi:protein SCO1
MRLLCKEECDRDKLSVPGNTPALISGVLVLLMPKCALCWAAYMSVLSSLGLSIQYRSWFFPVALVLFLATLIKLLIQAIRKRKFVNFFLAITAGALIYLNRQAATVNFAGTIAIILMILAVMMDNLLKTGKLIIAFIKR